MAVAPRPNVLNIEAYQGGAARLEGLNRVVKLSSNEAALGPSPAAIAAFEHAARELHRYPDGGAGTLKAALQARYGLSPERIVCGAGSDELISLLVQAYAGPGDEVLYPEHGFLMYSIAAHAAGATPVRAAERDLTADVDALLARAGPRTKLCFLANPNNPTGTYVSAAEVRRLRAGLPAHTLLVLDAAYAEFMTAEDYDSGVELVSERDDVVMTRTFSKLYGLAAARVGWAFCPEGVADALNRIRGPFNVNAAAQAAAAAALADREHAARARAHNEEWRAWLARAVEATGLKVTPSHGNFILVHFPEAPPRDARAADAWLKSRGLIARGVAAYGLPHCLRISIGLEDECRAVAEALAAFMERGDG